MKKFTVPATLTITGLLTIEAEDMLDAISKAGKLNIDGVEYTSVEGQYEWTEADESSEVLFGLVREEK